MAAPVRSDSAMTAVAVLATTRLGLAWISARSSLITSGRTRGIITKLAGSAPTSSMATPIASRRACSTAPSMPAGSLAMERSVISRTSRGCRASAAASGAARSGGQAEPNVDGSTLTNRASDSGMPASANVRAAAARHIQSSSLALPVR